MEIGMKAQLKPGQFRDSAKFSITTEIIRTELLRKIEEDNLNLPSSFIMEFIITTKE